MWNPLQENIANWGSSSFLEVVAALNLGFFTFEQFQVRVAFAKAEAIKLAAEALATVAGTENQDQLHSEFVSRISLARWFHAKVWALARIFSLIFGVCAVTALYCNWKNCSYEIVLILPIPAYLFSTYIGLKVWKWYCGRWILKPGAQKISETQEALRNLLSPAKKKD